MKSNLVKILATLGLIIAIAVILKSVFGIGNLGIKNLFSKDIYLACKNIEKDEVFTVKLNDKEKLWQEDWGTFNVFEWDKNKIEGYYIMWMETPLSDGTTKKEQISKEDYYLDRLTGRLKIYVYPMTKKSYSLSYDCSPAKQKF